MNQPGDGVPLLQDSGKEHQAMIVAGHLIKAFHPTSRHLSRYYPRRQADMC